jgi:hypothetical protein
MNIWRPFNNYVFSVSNYLRKNNEMIKFAEEILV